MLGRHLSNRRDLGQVSYFGLKGNVDAEDRQTLRTLEQIEAALVARGGHAPRKDYARGIHWSGNQAGSSPPSLLLPLPMSLLYTHSLPPYCCPYPCPYCTLTLSLPTVAPTHVPTVHSLC